MARMERISGPYMGYFIAAYSVEVANEFIGYAKVCTEEPSSVWSVGGVEKLTSASARSDLEAVVLAEQKARRAIAELAGWEQVSVPGALD